MKRGDLFRVRHPSARDPRKSRVFVVASRQALIDSRFSTVVCAPIYSAFDGLSTQVPVGVDQGLKHESAIHCDELVSLPKASLTDYVGSLDASSLGLFDRSLGIALALHPLPVAPPVSARQPDR